MIRGLVVILIERRRVRLDRDGVGLGAVGVRWDGDGWVSSLSLDL
jgi:hypothetical protein